MSLQKSFLEKYHNIKDNVKSPEEFLSNENVYILNSKSFHFSEVSKDDLYELNEDMQNRTRTTQKVEEKSLFGEKSEFIHIDLKDGDTLQKLALMFHCNISDIKLANKIYKEQDLHALKTIKIPVMPHSILHEEFCKSKEKENLNLKNLQTIDIPIDTAFDTLKNFEIKNDLDFLSDDNEDSDLFDGQSELHSLLDDKPLKLVKPGLIIDHHDLNIVDYLNVIDKRIEKTCAVLDCSISNLEELPNLMKTDFVFPNTQKKTNEPLGTLGSYTWTHYFFCFCFIAVICPTIGFLLYKFKVQ